MALPTSITTSGEEAFQKVLFTAQSVSSNLRGVGELIDNNSVILADNLIGLYQSLNAARDVGVTLQTETGLVDYAKTVMGESYDINAEFMNSLVACKAVTDWLLVNIPNDGNFGFVGWRKDYSGKINRLIIDNSSLGPLNNLIKTALATFS